MEALIPLLLIILFGYLIYQYVKGLRKENYRMTPYLPRHKTTNSNLPRYKTTDVDLAWLWCLLFTPTIYFFFIGLEKLALRCLFWTIITFGIAQIYYVFVAGSLVYEYQQGLRKDY